MCEDNGKISVKQSRASQAAESTTLATRPRLALGWNSGLVRVASHGPVIYSALWAILACGRDFDQLKVWRLLLFTFAFRLEVTRCSGYVLKALISLKGVL